MAIEANKVVTINYTLKDEKGEVLDSTENKNPFSYLSGNSQILPKLEDKINGMIIGSKDNIKLDPVEAYGDYKDEAVQKVNKSNFPNDAKLEEGMSFMANTPDGKQMPFVIKNIEGEDITVDFNHPLAGRSLEFDVELVDVREATTEELQHGHVHGSDGHHH